MGMTTEIQDWQLEAAQDLISTWENILQDQVHAARQAGQPQQEIFTLQLALYAAARQRKGVSRLTPAELRKLSEGYGQLIAEHRAKVAR